MKWPLVSIAGVAVLLASLAIVTPSAQAQSGCGSLLSSINQLRAQIPREPRDAAQSDQQVLNNYVGLYNRACTGGSGGGYRAPPGGGNNAANALGAGANLLGALSDLADQLDQEQRAAAQEQQQRELDAELERAQEEAAERAAAAAQRAQEAAARAADDANRQAMANPFAGAPDSTANPFAGPPSNTRAANPFGGSSGGASKSGGVNTASAAPPPRPAANNAGGAQGFKSDAQIKADCAKSGNPSVCEATEMSARGQSPAYRAYAAKQKTQLDQNIAAEQAKVDAAFKAWDQDHAKRTPPDRLGALPQILAGKLPADDDGLECGPEDGRRHRGQCYQPWDRSPEECAHELGGTYYPASADNATPFCATNTAANPMTAFPGPHEGEDCGDAGGSIHAGACWVRGITRDDCRNLLQGITVDNGGNQYCAYDANQLAQEQRDAAQLSKTQRQKSDLAKRLRDLLAARGGDPGGNADSGAPAAGSTAPGGGKTTAPTKVATGDPPSDAHQPWHPHYTCRLRDGTTFGTDDPSQIGGDLDPLHTVCRLDNSPPLVGLTPLPTPESQ